MFDKVEWHAQEKYAVHFALWPLAENCPDVAVMQLHSLRLIVATNDHGVRQDGHSLRYVPLQFITRQQLPNISTINPLHEGRRYSQSFHRRR